MLQDLKDALVACQVYLKDSKTQDLILQFEQLKSQSHATDFWQDNRHAQSILKKMATIEAKVTPWQNLEQSLNDIIELYQSVDDSDQEEVTVLAESVLTDYRRLKEKNRFAEPYDNEDVIVSIFAGAGGTDAQDWSAMLYRMYIRYAEKNNYPVHLIDKSEGEEAGIKSIVFSIEGENLYGMLKREHGVHRLVRLSPFNADNLRQTSFARVEILPRVEFDSDADVLDEKDLKIDVYRSGGKGGQSVNTTDSAVRVTHIPTGIVVAIQNERSQLQNKETALTILRSRLTQLKLEQQKEHIKDLKGPNEQAAWGNQIRNYVLHPYKLVKDIRSGIETSDVEGVLDGDIDIFLS